MRYRTLTAALAAAALVVSPMPSFAQTAPQPAVSQETGLALVQGDDSDTHRKKKRRLLLYILGGVAIAIAAYLIFIRDGDDTPDSP
jgi:hypothetical protein